MPFLKTLNTNIIANISGNTVEEYAEMAEKLSDAGVDIIEVNISCPNVKAGVPPSAPPATRRPPSQGR